MANALTAQAQHSGGIMAYVGRDDVKQNITNVIGRENWVEYIAPLMACVNANPQLAECTPASIITGGLELYTNGLSCSPQLGEAYLVPYNTKKKIGNQYVSVKEATVQIGWKGYYKMAVRSGQYKKILVSEVKEGELKRYNPITEEIEFSPVEDPAVRESLPVIGYYAMFRLMNGYEKVLYMTKESMLAYAKRYSSSYRYDLENKKRSCLWTTNFDEMAKKTMIRRLIGKWGIMSSNMQKAYSIDMAVVDEDGTARYVDNPNNVDVEAQVAEDIATNANSVEFIEEEPVKEEKPKAKRGPKPKGEPIPAPEPVEVASIPKPETSEVETVIDIEAVDDGPEWG